MLFQRKKVPLKALHQTRILRSNFSSYEHVDGPRDIASHFRRHADAFVRTPFSRDRLTGMVLLWNDQREDRIGEVWATDADDPHDPTTTFYRVL